MTTSLVTRSIGWVLLFLYIYNPGLIYLHGLKPRTILCVVGFLCFLFLGYRRALLRSLGHLVPCFAAMAAWAIFCVFVNGTTDLELVRFSIVTPIYLFAAFFLVNFARIRRMDDLMTMVVSCILVHNIIAFAGLLIPPVGVWLYSVQSIDLSQMEQISSEVAQGARAIGLGRGTYFFGGAITGVALLFSFYKIRFDASTNVVVWLGIIAGLLLTGLFIARTTLVGFIVGLCMFLLPGGRGLKRSMRVLLLAIVATSIFLPVVVSAVSQKLDVGWAFETFYLASGKVDESGSLEVLKSYYFLPSQFKTWFVGDARFTDGEGYYMHTDVGYLRLIFYFGVLGMLLFFWVQYKGLRRVFRFSPDRSLKFLLIFLLIFEVVVNAKGVYDINDFIFLMVATLVSSAYRRQREYIRPGSTH